MLDRDTKHLLQPRSSWYSQSYLWGSRAVSWDPWGCELSYWDPWGCELSYWDPWGCERSYWDLWGCELSYWDPWDWYPGICGAVSRGAAHASAHSCHIHSALKAMPTASNHPTPLGFAIHQHIWHKAQQNEPVGRGGAANASQSTGLLGNSSPVGLEQLCH